MNRLQKIHYLWEKIREILDEGPLSEDSAFYIGDMLGQLVFTDAMDVSQNGLDMVRTRLVNRGEFVALETVVSRYVAHIQAAEDWKVGTTPILSPPKAYSP